MESSEHYVLMLTTIANFIIRSSIVAPNQSSLKPDTHDETFVCNLLWSAVAGRLYKHHSKHTSNSGFDRSFMPCSCYILFAAEQRVGYSTDIIHLPFGMYWDLTVNET